MNGTIIDLWNGNIAPCERCGCGDPVIHDLMETLERNRRQLYSELTTSQMEILQKYIDCHDEYLLRMLELAFSDGFSLGSRLTVESYCNT